MKPDMNVSIQRLDSRCALAAPHRGPYHTISAAFARLDTELNQAGISRADCLEMVAIHHDDPERVPADELRGDAGVVVRSGSVVPAGLHLVAIPAGLYASTVYQGPYDGLGDAWGRLLGGWLVTSGRRRGAGPSYELYLNTPLDAAPHELRTELYLPLAESDAADPERGPALS